MHGAFVIFHNKKNSPCCAYQERGGVSVVRVEQITSNQENMSIAALLQAAEYLERRERGNNEKS